LKIKSLPPSTYEIVVDEPGYEQAQASTQLDGFFLGACALSEVLKVPNLRE